MTLSKEDHDRWTGEALEALKTRPEANPSYPTTETAAWRAGYVAGWIAAREREASAGENAWER